MINNWKLILLFCFLWTGGCAAPPVKKSEPAATVDQPAMSNFRTFCENWMKCYTYDSEGNIVFSDSATGPPKFSALKSVAPGKVRIIVCARWNLKNIGKDE